MSAAGFQVDPDVIKKYSEDVGTYSDQAAQIKDLVAQADVGDESWGVVGIFTKDSYTQALRQLQEQMQALMDGAQTAAEKFAATAEAYQEREDEAVRVMQDALDALDTCPPPPGIRRA
ncbi:ESX-1 secretion-associated protein [Haloechinothrix sp. YIM 98757]|uniref:ESX-1 secretion-associated protein n=1 Tax=Haloechinothrix aidingensis TaxID=2752311 RepID=A0A838A8K6_9PSEU|nr:type VII secretion target [Haloechinothrix aidingensis]MBA0124712.1 ESX-1 secretion-associated protein [Haloechinothrix aidingensis]